MRWGGWSGLAAGWKTSCEPSVIAGLPLSAWLLLWTSFGIGLALELYFYFKHQRRRGTARKSALEPGRRSQ